mgnify:CR=1 FL=1
MNEPRGSEAWVGALLCAPHDSSCDFGVIFFNNVGYLGMCGHGTIGLIETLRHQGRIEAGAHRIDSPVGPVTAMLHADRTVSVFNVRSYRHAAGVQVQVPGVGAVTGDIAWGGNWFFLVTSAPPCALEIANEPALRAAAIAVRSALVDQGITGKDGGYIDHISAVSQLVFDPRDPFPDGIPT